LTISNSAVIVKKKNPEILTLWRFEFGLNAHQAIIVIVIATAVSNEL
jgi:hypothetical protein